MNEEPTSNDWLWFVLIVLGFVGLMILLGALR
jgi:hypothetical protein